MCIAATFMVGCNGKQSDIVSDAINQSFKQMEEETGAVAGTAAQETDKQTLQDIADKLAIQRVKILRLMMQ